MHISKKKKVHLHIHKHIKYRVLFIESKNMWCGDFFRSIFSDLLLALLVP